MLANAEWLLAELENKIAEFREIVPSAGIPPVSKYLDSITVTSTALLGSVKSRPQCDPELVAALVVQTALLLESLEAIYSLAMRRDEKQLCGAVAI